MSSASRGGVSHWVSFVSTAITIWFRGQWNISYKWRFEWEIHLSRSINQHGPKWSIWEGQEWTTLFVFLGSAFVEQIQMIQCPCQCIGLSGYILRGLELVQQTVYSAPSTYWAHFLRSCLWLLANCSPGTSWNTSWPCLIHVIPNFTHEIDSKDIGPGKSILHLA